VALDPGICYFTCLSPTSATTKILCVLILLYVSSYSYICVLLYMCPHIAIALGMWHRRAGRARFLHDAPHVSSYYDICGYMCPHTTIYVFSYRYMALKSWEGKVSSRCATKCSTEAQVLSLLALLVQKYKY
jgi:hypothetical protein